MGGKIMKSETNVTVIIRSIVIAQNEQVASIAM